MMIISPYSRKLRNGNPINPKDYPYWNELVKKIKKEIPQQTIIQIGVTGETIIQECNSHLFDMKYDEIISLLKRCDTWISVDNFFPHLASYYDIKGIALFGQSDPRIFGCDNNINLLKHRKYVRHNQFDIYENSKNIKQSFIEPKDVMIRLNLVLKNINDLGGNSEQNNDMD